MFPKKVFCPPTSAKITEKCDCDVPVKVRKTYEQIETDKNLRELFRGDMRKNIFKLCAELGKVPYDDRDKKSITTSGSGSGDSSSKKSHFLPPLYSDEIESYETQGRSETGEGGVIDDWSRFQMGLSTNIDMDSDPNAYKDKGDDDFDPKRRKHHDSHSHKRKSSASDRMARKGKKGDYDPNAQKREGGEYDPNAFKGKGKGTGIEKEKGDSYGEEVVEEYEGEGYGDSEEDKDGKDFIEEQERKEIRFSDSSYSKWSRVYKKSVFDKYKNRGRPIKYPFSDEDMDKLDLTKDIYDEIEEDFFSMGEEDMGESQGNKYNFLLKYYQLKRLAEKMKARVDDTRAARVRGDKMYEDGYKVGFAEGHKRAYYEEPLDYSKLAKEDLVYYSIEDTQKRRKTIYIATHPDNIDELQQIFQDVAIEQCKRKEFSTETEKQVAKKVEMFLKEYRQGLLATKSPHFKLGFVDGFYDAYYQTFIYNPGDETFENDEKFYISEVRKCLSYSDDIEYDYKSIFKRADDLRSLVQGINFEEYEEEMRLNPLKGSLHLTKSDFLFFFNLKKPKKPEKAKKKKPLVLPPCVPTLLPPTRRFPVLPEMPQITQDLQLMFPAGKTRKTKTERAGDYMDRHKITDIFRYMGTMLCAYKPDDPIDFLINLLDKCLMFRVSEIPEQAPLVFTPKHVASIYNEMDPFHVGYIDGMQYLYGLNLLEVTEEDDENVENEDTIEMNQFLSNANNRLLEKFKDMIAIYGKEDTSYAHIYQ